MFALVSVLIILALVVEDLFTYRRLAKAKEKLVAAELKASRADRQLKVAQKKLELAKRQFGFTMNLLRDQQGFTRNALDIRDGVEAMATQLNELVIYMANPFDALPGGRHALSTDDDPYALASGPQLQEVYTP